MELLIKSHIRDVPDFPKPGIVFKDITPILKSPRAVAAVMDELSARYHDMKVDVIAGIESRGFLFGMPLAHRLGVPFVPLRKQGKLPYDTVEMSYDLEYGTSTIEMHVDAIESGQRVVVIDDLLATGGTAQAACALLERQGAQIIECAFVIELAFLSGRRKLGDVSVHALATYT